MSEKHSPARRGNSLVWKLSFLEVRHLLSAFAQINLFLTLLFAIGVIGWSEWRLGGVATEIAANPETPLPYSSDSVSAEAVDYAHGVTLPSRLERKIGLPAGSCRFLERGEWTSEQPFEVGSRWFHGRGLRYVVCNPREGGGYLALRLEIGAAVGFFFAGFILLFLVQIWIAFWSLWEARRTIHSALRPIYDLTMTARHITAGQQRAIPLSGAIDTLNAITGDALDQRIAIQDERQELQGLATAINSMLDRLDAAYRSQLRFVSDASHELRTPIAIIQGYAGLLDRWGKDDPETLREAIDAIKTEAHGMQDLIEQLLFLARSDNRSIPMQITDVDLSGLMDEVLRETEMIDKTHVIAGKTDAGLVVKADVQLLKQATRILVDNALKYTPDGGQVTVGARQDADKIRIWVSDEGVGISEEDLPKIFERFWRADESRTRGSGGTGLGLSIAQWIVDSHNGKLEIVSREGIGTRVTILLPASEAPARPTPPVEETPERHSAPVADDAADGPDDSQAEAV